MVKWKTDELSEHIAFIDYRGKTPTKVEFGMRLITAKNVKQGFVQLNPQEYVNPDIYVKWMTRGIPIKGDVLFTTEAPLGNVAQLDVDEKVVVGQRLITMQPDRNIIDPTFLKYSLLSPELQNAIHSRGTGATVLGIKAKLLKKILLSYPPIPEQQHIVAILDQAFADIEKARANAEQNLKNARELFDSYLQQVFSQRGEGWVELKLGEVAEFKNGLNFSQSSKGEELSIVGVRDFKSNFLVPLDQLDTIKIDGDLPSSYELKENDIITVRSNGNKRLIGRCMLVGPINYKTSYSGFTIRIRIASDSVDPEFLTYQMKSASVHEMLISAGDGANISNLNQKILTSLPLSYPNKKTQIQLVCNIKKMESKSNMLQMAFENKLGALDELKKSILQKAFSGELTKSKGTAALC